MIEIPLFLFTELSSPTKRIYPEPGEVPVIENPPLRNRVPAPRRNRILEPPQNRFPEPLWNQVPEPLQNWVPGPLRNGNQELRNNYGIRFYEGDNNQIRPIPVGVHEIARRNGLICGIVIAGRLRAAFDAQNNRYTVPGTVQYGERPEETTGISLNIVIYVQPE